MSGQRYSGETPWHRTRQVNVGATPAAGADWSVTVPAGEVWEVLAVYAALTADATAGNRAVRLQLGDGTAVYLDLAPPGDLAPSSTGRYAWLIEGPAYQNGNGFVGSLPRLILEPGWTIAASTDNLAAGDAWAAPRILALVTTVRGGPFDLASIPAMVVEVTGPSPS